MGRHPPDTILKPRCLPEIAGPPHPILCWMSGLFGNSTFQAEPGRSAVAWPVSEFNAIPDSPNQLFQCHLQIPPLTILWNGFRLHSRIPVFCLAQFKLNIQDGNCSRSNARDSPGHRKIQRTDSAQFFLSFPVKALDLLIVEIRRDSPGTHASNLFRIPRLLLNVAFVADFNFYRSSHLRRCRPPVVSPQERFKFRKRNSRTPQ